MSLALVKLGMVLYEIVVHLDLLLLLIFLVDHVVHVGACLKLCERRTDSVCMLLDDLFLVVEGKRWVAEDGR